MSQHAAQDLVKAISQARQSRKWLVVVCPNDDQLMATRRDLSAALNPDDRFSGRTATLEGGGTISVVSQEDEPFTAEDQSISVLFMGLWTGKGTAGMEKWRKAATELL
tara:strand:- start:643 stop:966 length:324 start_codon:yes stop_codon:yes gene_type:complete